MELSWSFPATLWKWICWFKIESWLPTCTWTALAFSSKCWTWSITGTTMQTEKLFQRKWMNCWQRSWKKNTTSQTNKTPITKFLNSKKATSITVYSVNCFFDSFIVRGRNELFTHQNSLTRVKELINRHIQDNTLTASHFFVCDFLFTSDFRESNDKKTTDIKKKCRENLKFEWL